jgi:DNA-binding HxlR family transcriptional regulator
VKGVWLVRVGAQALSLLSIPLNFEILQVLERAPLSLMDLRRKVGSPPQTTMRMRLNCLVDTEVLERSRETAFPGAVEYRLTPIGKELVAVSRALQVWLGEAPQEPLQLGTPGAKSAIKALTDGWSCGLVRTLAARPLSLTEVSGLIPGLSYPSLERRLGGMRMAGQIAPAPDCRGKTPYLVTSWLRRAIAPLVVAGRWEQQYCQAETPPFRRIDVESIFLLAVPLISLEAGSGSCRLVIDLGGGGGQKLAGALVEMANGAVQSCVTQLEGEADAWATGSIAAWLQVLIEGDEAGLEIGGDGGLATSLTAALNRALFQPNPTRAASFVP